MVKLSMDELMDILQKKRLEAIKTRVRDFIKLPLQDRKVIPHEEFMKLTAEFLDLIKQWKELDNPR